MPLLYLFYINDEKYQENNTMTTRPTLTKQLDAKTFREFYYLKEELVDFCKANGLPSSGGKVDITNRIAEYLEFGKITATKATSTKSTSKKNTLPDTILESSLIEPNFVCSEKHRTFFKEKIGKSFSFNVVFQKWLKNNTGKTYVDAIDAYYLIL